MQLPARVMFLPVEVLVDKDVVGFSESLRQLRSLYVRAAIINLQSRNLIKRIKI